jgi:ATP-dependent Clp protease ATP-binding subunit ClpA
VLFVGEHGVGKTAVARAALDRLPPSSLVIEATAARVHAGAVHVGELETRVKEIVERLRGRDVVWVFPEFEAALYAGQHSRSTQGLLDALLPHIESGELTLVAEAAPAALERMLAERPRIASAFRIVASGR